MAQSSTPTLMKVQTYISSSLMNPVKEYLQAEKFSINKDDALNSIIYGMKCDKVVDGKASPCIVYQINKSKTVISLAHLKKKTIEFFDLKSVKLISFNPKTENLIKYTELKNKRIINFLIDRKTIDILFEEPNDLNTFAQSLIYLNEVNKENDKDLNVDSILKNVWMSYDHDFSGHLDKKEFKKFVKQLGRHIDAKSLFNALDLNKNGVIDYEEFVNYFKSFISGNEFKHIFRKYQNENQVLTPSGLNRFFKENQEENFNESDVAELIIYFKSNIPKEEKKEITAEIAEIYKNAEKEKKPVLFTKRQVELLQMTLSEFKVLIYSSMTDVFDKEKLENKLKLNRPINDYYINSTHNTYLTGHQLAGESSVNMYSYAMLDGYRLVELDCYNGKGDSITITHGFTMAGEIELKDVLVQLRNTAFINSKLPVILSIENHLDKEHQLVMANLFRTILKDLYILPYEDPPDYLPNLSEMLGKFIIKCGGMRIQKDRTKITPRSELNYSLKNTSYPEIITSLVKILEKDEAQREKEEENDIEVESVAFKNMAINVKQNSNNNEITKTKNGLPVSRGANLLKDLVQEEENQNDNNEEKPQRQQTELEKVRGFLGTKFNLDKIKENNYQPWEFVTIKSTQFESYCKLYETRRAIIKFNQNSLMKAYPQSFNSNNYDPIKCWMIGCHVASMNIQATEDNWTLLNMIFFKQNQKCGYVLKPKKLLPESTKIEIYDKPCGALLVTIQSIVNVVKVLEKAKKPLKKKFKMELSCWVVGSLEDDKNNKKYTFKISENYLFPELLNNEEMKFDIYEKDLGAIFFKLTYDDDLIGRSVVPFCMMKNGLRRVKFYTNLCEELSFSFLIAEFKTIFD